MKRQHKYDLQERDAKYNYMVLVLQGKATTHLSARNSSVR
jgi:hypothetical protein